MLRRQNTQPHENFDANVNPLWPAVTDTSLREDIFQSGGAATQSSFAGDIAILEAHPRIAIIGSRRATPRGIAAAEELATELTELHAPIVSGAADGIDLAAHLATLAAGGTTIACLPFGLSNINCAIGKPSLLAAANHRLLLLSPFPPRQAPSRSTPVVRNRLIASLADAVVAIEFGPASGTLHCLRFAARLARPIFIVQPHATTDPNLQAIHRTLKAQGASFLTTRTHRSPTHAHQIIEAARAHVQQRSTARNAQLRLLPE